MPFWKVKFYVIRVYYPTALHHQCITPMLVLSSALKRSSEPYFAMDNVGPLITKFDPSHIPNPFAAPYPALVRSSLPPELPSVVTRDSG